MAGDLTKTGGRWAALRAATPARLFLPQTGSTLTTRAVLEFQLAHAEARDAVDELLDVGSFVERLESAGLDVVSLRSMATDRRTYLSRPDLGRRLDESSRLSLSAHAGSYDIVFVIVDGLSARAVTSHAAALLAEALPLFSQWRAAPVIVVEHGRVAIGDEIAQIIGSAIVAVLIGERPGLTSPDSLGIYLTYAPYVGCTDAERNCLSNIHAHGMSYADAAQRLFYLGAEARRRKLSGTGLKDATP
jgi:ethanolamine ammonia-lyase small subunit